MLTHSTLVHPSLVKPEFAFKDRTMFSNDSVPDWVPFREISKDTLMNPLALEHLKGTGQTVEQYLEKIKCVMLNTKYQVIIREYPWLNNLVIKHLSIRNIPDSDHHVWQEFQLIKDELCGVNCEAVELYPAQSRLIDFANQYHLWVLPSGARFPIGFWTEEDKGEKSVKI